VASDPVRKLLDEFGRIAAIVCFFGIIGLTVGYFVVSFNSVQVPEGTSGWQKFVVVLGQFFTNLSIELIPIFLAVFISYWLFRKIQETRSARAREDLSQHIISEIKTMLNSPEQIEDISKRVAAEIRTTLISEQLGLHPDSSYYEEFGKAPWNELLDNCATLDICVHYFDRPSVSTCMTLECQHLHDSNL
jgi:hypothetical protein